MRVLRAELPGNIQAAGDRRPRYLVIEKWLVSTDACASAITKAGRPRCARPSLPLLDVVASCQTADSLGINLE